MINFMQKLGSTRSSKPIMQPTTIETATLEEINSAYTDADHFDAHALFQYLLSRELATVGRDSPRLEPYNEISDFHSNKIGAAEIASQKRSLDLATIFDVIEFGKCRADSVFI